MKKTITVFSLMAALFLVPSTQAAIYGDFGVDAGLSWGLGSVHNSSNSIAGRTVNALALNAFPNYTYAGFQFGVLGSLAFIGQNTTPSSVGNSNVKGTSWLVGVGVEYQIPLWTFSAGFNFLGNYTLSEKTAAGQDVAYKKPIGFILKAGYFFIPMVSLDASYSMVSFGTNSVAGVDSDISSNKITETNYALGATYHW